MITTASGQINLSRAHFIYFLSENTFFSITPHFQLGDYILRFKSKQSTDMIIPCSVWMSFDYTEAKLCKIRPFPSYFCLYHHALCSRKTPVCSKRIPLCSGKTSLCFGETALCSGRISLCSGNMPLWHAMKPKKKRRNEKLKTKSKNNYIRTPKKLKIENRNTTQIKKETQHNERKKQQQTNNDFFAVSAFPPVFFLKNAFIPLVVSASSRSFFLWGDRKSYFQQIWNF